MKIKTVISHGTGMIPQATSGAVAKEVDLEEALDLAGAGKYQFFHAALMLAALASSLIEMIGYTFILPAAACDFHLSATLMGPVASIPNIGIIITAPFWGRAADIWGRKPILLLSSAAAGTVSLAAAFMPNLLGFSLCKLVGALFLSCPTSLSYAYAGEMTPHRRRDFVVLMCNGFLTLSSVVSPLFFGAGTVLIGRCLFKRHRAMGLALGPKGAFGGSNLGLVLAWGVLSTKDLQLGLVSLRSWRLLTIVYAAPLILVAVWVTQAKESPKFLMAKGRSVEALEVLRQVYAKNTGKSPESYSVTSLKSHDNERDSIQYGSDEQGTRRTNQSALALLKPPHLKWFALTCFLMFGLFTLLNGLWLFATDTINKVLREPSEETGTLCELIDRPDNTTTSTESCNATISQNTFVIMVLGTFACALVVMAGSMSPISKKTLLVAMYLTSGVACLLAGILTNRIVAGGAMAAFQVSSVGIGALTAYAVDLFPTCLRGTAVGALMMFGRVGAMSGASVAGYLLANACNYTFYGFASLLFLCAALSLLLPNDKARTSSSSDRLDTATDKVN